MLTYLKIENLALIEHSEVEFAPGFNVITGETGAGKSILLGAVSLLLGARADRSVIRSGAVRCEICGAFMLPERTCREIKPMLDTAEIPFDPAAPELQLRRIIGENSGRCQVNNVPVTVKFLHDLGEFLIDVHGANEHQSLISRARQLELLDRYADTVELRNCCRDISLRRSELAAERDDFEKNMPSQVEAAHLEMIIGEIERLNPQPGEDEELNARYQLAANSKALLESAAQISAMLDQCENSVSDQMAQVYRLIQDLAHLAPEKGGEFIERCALLAENIADLSSDIADFGSSVELDEESFAELENRLGGLNTLKRRYGSTLENVLKLYDECRRKTTAFRDGEKRRAEFTAAEKNLRGELQRAAAALTARRMAGAADFTAAVCRKLELIGFAKGQLQAEFSLVEPGANGQDQLELLFSANAGENLLPLRKVASSGELSRLMLALKTVLSDADAIPVAVFDEIDVNIGGETAFAVARELKNLGRSRQLLAISHLPQVAAQGDAHFAVHKAESDARRTVSFIRRLNANERLQEIARMLGSGEAALKHAKSLCTP